MLAPLLLVLTALQQTPAPAPAPSPGSPAPAAPARRSSTATIQVRVTDRSGNPAPDAHVVAEAAILTEGDRAQWMSVISLGHLPVWVDKNKI